MMGTCKGCGTENVEVNEEGMCANCATPSTDTGMGADTGAMPEGGQQM